MRIISVTTDLGTKDHYLAVLKAKILSKSENVRCIDITNDIEPYDILSASKMLRNSYLHFPEGSIHVLLVNNDRQREPQLLFFSYKEHFFIVPDNGIPGLLFKDVVAKDCRRVRLDIDRSPLMSFEKAAHAVACICNGLFEEIGPNAESIVEKMVLQPVVTKDEIRATIIEIDRFENVITNLHKSQFDKVSKGRRFELFYKHDEPLDRVSKNYGDVEIGDPLCLFNSSGFLEIAINMGKAASLYGLRNNETIQIHFFES